MLSKLANLFLYRLSPIFKFKIKGHSMFPALHDGQIIFVNRLSFLFKNPKIGDIVAARINGKVFIKRITKIEKDNYFLSGDNKTDSFDSTKFGMITKRDIVGKTI